MSRKLAWATLAVLSAVLSVDAAPSRQSSAPVDSFDLPLWQPSQINPLLGRGLEISVPEADNLADFHGDIASAELNLYVGGSYFFAMPLLLAGFEDDHPELRGRVYYETLPPSLLAKQIDSGGRITVGNMTWTARPDAYLGELTAVQAFIKDGLLVGPPVAYATSQLAIMVPKGNPARVRSLLDLGRTDITVSVPNPASGGIARSTEAALLNAGGSALVAAIYDAKVRQGTTLLTQINHRQAPVWLMDGRSEAGVVWRSETIFQEQAGLPTERVDIPIDQNVTSTFGGAVVKGAAHDRAARLWLDYLQGNKARSIFARYGFGEYPPMTEARVKP